MNAEQSFRWLGWRVLIRWALLAIPFLAIAVALDWQSREQGRRQAVVDGDHLETALFGIAAQASLKGGLEKRLNDWSDEIRQSPKPEVAFEEVRARLDREWPGLFEPMIVASGGMVLPADPPIPASVARALYRALEFYPNRSSERITSALRQGAPHFGLLRNAQNLSVQCLHRIGIVADRRFLYIGFPDANGLFLCFVNADDNVARLCMQKAIAEAHSRDPRSQFFLFDLSEQDPPARGASGPSSITGVELAPTAPPWGRAWVEMERRGDRVPDFLGWQWQRVAVADDLHLLGAIPSRMERGGETSMGKTTIGRVPLLWLGWLLCGTVATLMARLDHHSSRTAPGITRKLLSVFLLATGVPLGVFLLLSLVFLRDRRQALENDAFHRLEAQAQRLDRMFLGWLTQGYYTRRTGFQQDLIRGSSSAARLAALTSTLNRTDLLGLSSVRVITDAAGRVVYRGSLNDSMSTEVPSWLFEMVAERVFAPDEADRRETTSTLARSSTLEGVLEVTGGFDVPSFLRQLSRHPFRWIDFRMGESNNLFGVLPTFCPDGQPEFLVFFGFYQTDLQHEYLTALASDSAFRRQVAAISWFGRERQAYGTSCSEKGSRQREMLLNHIERTREAVRRRLRPNTLATHSEPFLAVGLPGVYLEDFSLLCEADAGPIERELATLRRGLFAVGALLLGLSALIGIVLGRTFLAPVGALSRGIDALRRRDFRYRIEGEGEDEFGHLSRSFNAMLESLGDLELGRIVQESLFPREALQGPAFAVFGRCLPAAEMGGDYFDYFPLDQDRFAVVVGDVSGHGVGAALVMAMAKGVMTKLCADGLPAIEILTRLNQVLLTSLERRKMFSVVFLVLEPAAARLTMVNAGQSFPLLVRAGAATGTYLEQVNYPLGTRAKITLTSIDYPIRPGDRLILFSDGLIEAARPDGSPIGYEALAATVPRLLRASPQESEAAIRAWAQAETAAAPLADDLTIVAVHLSKMGEPPPAFLDTDQAFDGNVIERILPAKAKPCTLNQDPQRSHETKPPDEFPHGHPREKRAA
jgi:HAMP domain-containing protein